MQTRNYLLLITSCLLAAGQAYGQGTRAVLRCMFKGAVELHATMEASSPVIARIACGESILLIDQRRSGPRVRTRNGQEGYIISFNGGQWSIQSEPETSSRPATS